VVRDGTIVDIAAVDLVPGDLVIVSEGESFPADGLIVSGDALQVDESALTGEAMPVHKQALDDLGSGDAEVSVDSIYWGSAGTRLLTGKGSLRIIYTGANTLYGQIVRSAQAGSFERTPLQIAISTLVSVLVVVAIFLCIALAGIRYYQGYGLLEAVNRQTRLRFFNLQECMVIACVGVLITLLVILGYDHSLGADNDVAHARSMAMVALIVAGVAVTSTLSGLRSRSAVIAVVATISSALIIVQLQPVAQLLHLNPLHFTDWILAALGGLLTGALAGLMRLMHPA